jgi:hypothetical protein
LLRDRSRNGVFDSRLRMNATRQERNMIMEPLMAAAEVTDLLSVGRSGVYRLIAARQRESIKIGRPQWAVGRLDPPRRSPECGVVYVAGGLALRS